MIEFITNNWYIFAIILIIIATITLCIFFIKKGYKTQINKILLYLVTEAEKTFGVGTGALKFSAVSTWLYEKLPSMAKIFLTSSQIDAMIENAVIRMKEYFEKNSRAEKSVFIENKI